LSELFVNKSFDLLINLLKCWCCTSVLSNAGR